MATKECGTTQEDGRGAGKAATAMEEVGKAGCRTEHGGAERIDLVSLDGEQLGRWKELLVDGHSVEREMPCWVEAGPLRGKNRSSARCQTKPNRRPPRT